MPTNRNGPIRSYVLLVNMERERDYVNFALQ